jgi:TonB family protein
LVVPESEPGFSGKVTNSSMDHDSRKELALHLIANREEILLLSTLKNLVSSGDHRLDPMLAAIADGARRLTGASGAALAMWKDGAMVCRGRSGEMAPPLGAQLSTDSGISGECLRTGRVQHCPDTENSPLVDADVCRSLGLRSIAVLPIPGWRGVNGILEVFSTEPEAFTQHHLALLEHLTVLAERARALHPHGASPTASKEPTAKAQPTGILPASDRVEDVALAFVGPRFRPLVVGAVSLAAIILLAFVIWLGWRGPNESTRKAHAASPPVASAGITVHPSTSHLPDDDPVWKPNPGGEVLISLGSKPSPGSPVKPASKVEVMEENKVHPRAPLLKADAANIAPPQHGPALTSASNPKPPDSAASDAHNFETQLPAVDDAPTIPTESSPSTLKGILTAKATPPVLSAPVSQGISGGRLLNRTAPLYPDAAQTQRIQGRVVVEAMVMEDGSVGELKVVQGHPLLAQSAVEAVKRWRYQPFMLDGRPIRRETTVTIDFKLTPKTH